MLKEMNIAKAVFLDRDGTINVERDYLFRCEEFEFISGVPEAIKKLNDAGFLVVVVTNQSGVARGYYSEADVMLLHDFVEQQLALYSARVDGFYFCPHHPDKGQPPYRKVCRCRKGAAGMLLDAARDFQIDLSQSYIVGDKLADVEAGLAVDSTPILVLTGHGEREKEKIPPSTQVCSNLSTAVDFICEVK
ncbi:MAG: D-glycero-beta-D-manno-heptose-1,7-bisphosphate 7-phosphatase [Desulfobacteraceae bacterium 4572_35.2]|nr:MAG: D-glycero-beta-D-manno-heptose-1,7-bisphosphate 7-phosphatase [Desulfobacteraceae bacterium 4572_35.2]